MNFYDVICFQLNFPEDILLVGTKEGHLLQYRIKKGTGKTLCKSIGNEILVHYKRKGNVLLISWQFSLTKNSCIFSSSGTLSFNSAFQVTLVMYVTFPKCSSWQPPVNYYQTAEYVINHKSWQVLVFDFLCSPWVYIHYDRKKGKYKYTCRMSSFMHFSKKRKLQQREEFFKVITLTLWGKQVSVPFISWTWD